MLDAYHKVLAWNPDSVPALLGQATALWAQGRLNEAMESYRRVITQKLVPARAWLDIARLEAQRQFQEEKPEWRDAETVLEHVTKIDHGARVAALARVQIVFDGLTRLVPD